MAARYGMPVWPPDPWPMVTVGHPVSLKDPEREVPAHPDAVWTRHQMSLQAYRAQSGEG